MSLLDSIKPVFGQFGDVLDLVQVFVGFFKSLSGQFMVSLDLNPVFLRLFALLDSVKSVLGQCGVV